MSRLVTLEELPALVRQARIDAGLTLRQLAEQLEVSNPAVSKAENDGTGRYVTLQGRILKKLTGVELEGPLYNLKQ